MRSIWKHACLATAAFALCCSCAQVGADEGAKAPGPEELMKAMAETGQPGPEHEKLKALEGNWTYSAKLWMDPSQPAVKTNGTIERRLILGGRFLEEKYNGEGFDGKPGFEAFALIGYDKAQGKYTMTWACNMGTGVARGEGTADASGKKLTFETKSFCPLRKKVIQGRDEFRVEGDKIVAESYVLEDGKEVKIMESVAVRQK